MGGCSKFNAAVWAWMTAGRAGLAAEEAQQRWITWCKRLRCILLLVAHDGLSIP